MNHSGFPNRAFKILAESDSDLLEDRGDEIEQIVVEAMKKHPSIKSANLYPDKPGVLCQLKDGTKFVLEIWFGG